MHASGYIIFNAEERERERERERGGIGSDGGRGGGEVWGGGGGGEVWAVVDEIKQTDSW